MKDTVEDLCNQQQYDFEIKRSKVRGQVINKAHIRTGYTAVCTLLSTLDVCLLDAVLILRIYSSYIGSVEII